MFYIRQFLFLLLLNLVCVYQIIAQTSFVDDFTTDPTNWTTQSSNYSLTASAGTLKVDARPGIKFENFQESFAEINILNTPYVQIDIKSAVAVTVRIDLLDYLGHTTNTTETKLSIPASSVFNSYIFDFSGKFTQTYPSDSTGASPKPFVVDASRISKISLFINPSSTASVFNGSVHFDNLKIGSNVNVPVPPSGIRVNQIGFYPSAPKKAVIAQINATQFFIVSSNGNDTLFNGDLPIATRYAPSGELVSIADFSKFSTEGVYTVNAGTYKSSPFKIYQHVHNSVGKGLIKSYYFNRASTAIKAPWAEQWPRPYNESNDPELSVFVHLSAQTDYAAAGYVFSSPKGWFDAGDYNKYVVNAGISTYTMLALYEHYPSYFDSLNTKIPESGNSLPDLLDEALWELEWLRTMQIEDGSVYNKITEEQFAPINVMPMQDQNSRYAVNRGTAAACDFAAIMAQAARIFSNPSFEGKLPFTNYADSCLNMAKRAYAWSSTHSTATITSNPAGIGTGVYGDGRVSDELAWARMELFITTQDPIYYSKNDLTPTNLTFPVPGYTNSNTLGLISMVHYRNQLSNALGANVSDTTIFKSKLLTLANGIKNGVSGYGTPFGVTSGEFYWGSNAAAGNQGMILLQAYRLTKDATYLKAAIDNLDYLLGRNATGYSFVTGYGSITPMNPHHRISNSDGVVPPVPGMLVGGPNSNPDSEEKITGYPLNPARSYLDVLKSHSTNEPAINYTAAAMYLANGVEAIMAGGVGDIVPVAKGKDKNALNINLYPNPTKEDIFLEFINKGKGKITIADISGKILLEKASTANGIIKEHMSVSELSPGIYFISIVTDEGATTRKFIKN